MLHNLQIALYHNIPQHTVLCQRCQDLSCFCLFACPPLSLCILWLRFASVHGSSNIFLFCARTLLLPYDMYVCGRGCECGWVRLCVSAKLDLQHPPHHLPAPPLQAGARQLRRGNGHEQLSTHPHGISSITRRIEIRFACPPYACPPHTPPRNNYILLPGLHRVHPCMHIYLFV